MKFPLVIIFNIIAFNLTALALSIPVSYTHLTLPTTERV